MINYSKTIETRRFSNDKYYYYRSTAIFWSFLFLESERDIIRTSRFTIDVPGQK